jgi:hypothetical protein
MFYLAVLLGCVIYLGLQLNGVFTLPDFKWSIFLKTNAIPTILNLIIGCALVLIKDELINIYPITLLSALILGITGQAVIKKFTNMFDNRINTVIGVNK